MHIDHSKASGLGCAIRLPAASIASRRIATKSRFSVRGFVVAAFAGEPAGRRIHFESGLERDFLLLTLARPDVVSIAEQPPAIIWTDAHGRRVRYTFDFLVHLDGGRRLAVEVKRAERVRRKRIDLTLAAIAAQLPVGFADEVILFTDEHYERWQAVNAAQLHEARKQPDAAADYALSITARDLRGEIGIGDLAAMLDIGGRGFRAVLRGLFNGALRLATPGIVGPRSRVAMGGPA